MTYDNCLHEPTGQIDLFISHSRVFFILSHFDQTRLTLRDFYYCLLAALCTMPFKYQNEFPSHSDHNFYHHIQFASLPPPPPLPWTPTKLFHNSKKRGSKKKIWEKRQKMRKKEEEKFFIFNVVIECCCWYVIWEKVSLTKQEWRQKKIDENRIEDRKWWNYIRFATINRLLRVKAFEVIKGRVLRRI